MAVIKVPPRLRLASSLLLVGIPVAMAEAAVAARAPWWRLPWNSMGSWGVFAAASFVPLILSVQRGHWVAHRALGWIGGIWCSLSVFFALRTGNSSLAFMALFFGFGGWVIWTWIAAELNRSFFDAGVRWYQGVPRMIPGLVCLLEGKACGVSRFDAEGAFLCADEQQPWASFRNVELKFVYRDRETVCKGALVRVLRDNRCAGYRFKGMGFDQRTQLGDLVESLRGEGHVG